MDKDCFTDSAIPPLQFEPTMPLFPWTASFDQLSTDQYSHFGSSIPASTSNDEAGLLRKLVGNLSCTVDSTCFTASATATSGYVGNISPRTGLHLPNFVCSGTPLPPLAADPGFVERAAKFSCFGSRSFNGRTTQLGLTNTELGQRSSNPLMGELKLPRVSSSPILKHGGSPPQLGKCSGNSNDDSSASDQLPSAKTGSKTSNELNRRKRKAVFSGKLKEDRSNFKNNGDEKHPKRSNNPQTETNNATDEGSDQKNSADIKPPEPPKDYIHVRARRGQATDSHSLAERVRREKISERMKLLQDLVPGCNKVTGKALMLDEIINYVQSLQRQVEFLSMKLASVNPTLDFNMENLLSKDNTTTLPRQMYPLDPSAPAPPFQQHQPQNLHHLHTSLRVDQHPLPINPPFDGFCENLPPQFPGFSDDDLHSIMQMGFLQNPVNFPVAN